MYKQLSTIAIKDGHVFRDYDCDQWHNIIMESQSNLTWRPTSKTDLINILRNCPKCFHSTYDGELIIPLNEILSLPKKKLKKHKITNIIINFNSHWCLAGIFWRQHSLVLCDPLNTFSTNANAMTYINQFSQKHNLKLFFFSATFQLLTSSNCGQLCLALMAVLNTKGSLISFCRFRKRLLKHSIRSNETYLLQLLKNHFKLY